MIVYVTIGNSDDKLSQRQWCEFVQAVEEALEEFPIHGIWFSRPDAMWQNACWCIEVSEPVTAIYPLRKRLRQLAGEFNQDSITWAQTQPEFLTPTADIPAEAGV